jgi:hypothetical protein
MPSPYTAAAAYDSFLTQSDATWNPSATNPYTGLATGWWEGGTAGVAAIPNALQDAVFAVEHVLGLAADARTLGTIFGRLADLEAATVYATGAPASPEAGDIWTRSTDLAHSVFDGTDWRSIGGRGRAATVAAASALALPTTGFLVPVTGTAAVLSMTVTGNTGRVIALEVQDAITFTDDDAALDLEDDFIGPGRLLVGCTGTAWLEIARSNPSLVMAWAASGTIAQVGTAIAAGTAASAARGDHVHTIGASAVSASAQIVTGLITDAHVAAANKDGLAATPSMRTIGTGSVQAAAGDHAHAGGGGHTIEAAGTPLAQRTSLNFSSAFDVTDDSGNDETDVAANFGTGAGEIAEGNHSHGGGAGDATSLQGDAINASIAPTVGQQLTFDGSEWDATDPPVLNGAYGALPAAATAGRLGLLSDAYALWRDTGAAWAPWGPIMPLTKPPALASFTWRNQGSASAADDAGAIVLQTPTAQISFKILEISAPTPPYTITAMILGAGGILSNWGLCWTDGTKIACMIVDVNGNDPRIGSHKFNSVTSFSATYTSLLIPHGAKPALWLQVSDDNTNRICRFSNDGKNWYQVHSVGRTDFLTPTTVGWFADGGASSTQPTIATLLSWKQT